MAELFHPPSYASWFRSPLGEAVWADERRALEHAIGPVSGLRILDAGTGEGRYAMELEAAGASVVGLDRSTGMLDAARARGGAGAAKPEWVQGDVRALPFRSNSFDVAIAVTVLCFAAEPDRLIGELARVVRPGGRVVIGELGRWSTWAMGRRLRRFRGSDRWRKAHFWSRRELKSLLAGAGLKPTTEGAAVFYPKGLYHCRALRTTDEVLGRHFSFGAAFIVAVGRK